MGTDPEMAKQFLPLGAWLRFTQRERQADRQTERQREKQEEEEREGDTVV